MWTLTCDQCNHRQGCLCSLAIHMTHHVTLKLQPHLLLTCNQCTPRDRAACAAWRSSVQTRMRWPAWLTGRPDDKRERERQQHFQADLTRHTRGAKAQQCEHSLTRVWKTKERHTIITRTILHSSGRKMMVSSQTTPLSRSCVLKHKKTCCLVKLCTCVCVFRHVFVQTCQK